MNPIGKSHIRVDGKEKVTGKARYGNDLKFRDMLYAACRYSDIPAGKITKLDISLARSRPGVEAIALYHDVPGEKKVGPIRRDYLPLVNDEVFFTGDVIACIAATTRRAALQAANAVIVEYDPYEPVTDPREAVLRSSRLVHPEYKSNIVNHYPLRKGNVERGFRDADFTLSKTFQTGFQEHAYIEPETVTVVPDEHLQGYKIYGSIQNPYTTRKVVALFMNIDLNRITVIPSTLGGSFGGKDDIINNIACRTALLCQMTGKPVQMTYSRETSFKESYKRHPYYLTYKAGFKRNGKITALEIDILADSGAYSSQTFFVTWRSVVQAAGPYEIPHVKTDIKGVYTNNSYTAAFRGFGSPQVIFAIESLLDEIAAKCRISPLQIRLINVLQQSSITATGQKLNGHTVSLKQVLNQAAEAADYRNKIQNNQHINRKQFRYKKGTGIACSFRGCSLGAEGTDTSSAVLSVQADGSVILFTGVTENGQGLQTTMSLIAAHELGISLEKIVFLKPRTSIIADGGPTVASRGTIAGGNAVKNAAQKIKERLFPLIKEKLHVSSLDEVFWQDGKISSESATLDFSEIIALAFQKGINMSAYGWFKAPEVSWNEETGQGNAYFTYVYGCQIADITVDTYTGKITVDHIWAAHDLGKTINLPGAQGQIYGGVVQGLGYALTEDFNVQKGIVKSDNFDTYLIPTIKDAPPITPLIIENPDPAGPLGAKSLGEPTLELISAAINNALYNATAVHSCSLPLSLEQVYLHSRLQKPARQSRQNLQRTHQHYLKADVKTPSDLREALNLLQKKEYKILAGGTDICIQLRSSQDKTHLLNIAKLTQLNEIKVSKDDIIIGSAVTFSRIINHPALQTLFPVLVSACRKIGSTQIRNIATIGGNLVNAAPCADSAPPLILYNAWLVLKSFSGSRKISVADFITGSYSTLIKSDELLISVHLPIPSQLFTCNHYYQLGRRQALNITRLSLALAASFSNDSKISQIHLAAGSLLSRPARLMELENFLMKKTLDERIINECLSKAENLLQESIGKRWSASYKIPVFLNLLQAALLDIKSQYTESVKND